MAAAQSEHDDDAGRTHYQAGASYYESGEYEDAVREFTRAYELSQKPTLFYNIALCYQQVGDLSHAIEYLRRYLADVADVPNRDILERRIASLERRLAEQQEQNAGGGAATDGDHSAHDGVADDGSTERIGDQVAYEPAEDGGGAASGGGGVSTLAIIGFVAAGVGVATMATFGTLALSEESSIADGCGASAACMPDDVSTMDTFALVSDIGLGVVVAGAAVGVLGLILGDGGSDSETTSAGATAHVSPYVSLQGAGAFVRGAF